MRIAIDAMGGDFAPREIVAGAVIAAESLPGIDALVLVGDEVAIRRELQKARKVPASIEILHASEVVEMEEAPALAIRRKKDSSISRAMDLVKGGQADAMISAGNTGAVVVAATLKLRTLKGIDRPAIATVMPSPAKPFVLIDAGANTDCPPKLLYQFAAMGHVYSRKILGVANPLIGLMSVGGEDSKGNEATKEAFRLLSESKLNFKGNIEGNDLFKGEIDVVVCDGFVGNVILKTSEGLAHAIGIWIRKEFTRNPIRMLGAVFMLGAVRSMKRQVDAETYGGAPLLGVNGLCIIGHGSSSARSIVQAIRAARDAVNYQVNELIIDAVGGVT
jgi:glycerol-3-phosphate acyltransferase PlsX